MENIFIDALKITAYMIKNKLSKSEFCKRCNISTYTYAKIYKQSTNISIGSLLNIAREMNTFIGDLFI